MSSPRRSSRRAFLRGSAAQDALAEAGDRLADGLLGDDRRAVPQIGPTLRLETRAMACVWQVMLPPGPSDRVMEVSEIFDEVHLIEDALTVYRDDGELRRLNENRSTKPVTVSSHLFAAIDAGLRLTAATGRRFDVTSESLIALWRRRRAEDTIPSQTEIDEALACCGPESVRLDPQARTIERSRPGVAFNMGGLGKGFALDGIASLLLDAGIDDFLIHGGHSSVYAAGTCGTADGWPVALRNPLLTEEVFGTYLLKDQGLSSSGSNVQYFRHKGRRYGHLLDPRTGWPADRMLSATVIAPTATAADALSTAFFVGGLDFARDWCDTAAPKASTDADRASGSPEPAGSPVWAVVTPKAEGRQIEPVSLGEEFSASSGPRFYPQRGAAVTRPTDHRRAAD